MHFFYEYILLRKIPKQWKKYLKKLWSEKSILKKFFADDLLPKIKARVYFDFVLTQFYSIC